MMKIRKSAGPNEISFEVLKCLGDVGVPWLTNPSYAMLILTKWPMSEGEKL